MSSRFPDLRDHPVIAIIVGFAVLAAIAVPSLLALSEPSEGPPGGSRAERPGESASPSQAVADEGRLTVADARPVASVAAMMVSQDDAFPGYRAQLLTMAPQVDDSTPTPADDGQQAEAEDAEDAESAADAMSGWVEVYALTPDDAPAREPGDAPTQQEIGILVRSGEGGVRTRQVVGEEVERDAPQQVVAASYDAGTVVWQETPSTDVAELPFVLYAWSTDSGETTELARSADVRGAPAPPVAGFTGPVLRGGTVLWSQVVGGDGGDGGGPDRTDVLACQVDECEPQVVQRDAAYPTTGPEGFAVLARGIGEESTGSVSLIELGPDLQPVGEPRPLPAAVDTVTGFAGSSSGYVVLETPAQQSTRALLFDSAGDQSPGVVVGPPAGGFVYAVAGERLAAWGFAGAADEPVGGYAYDRETGDLLSLGDSSSRYGVAVAEGRVAFQVEGDRDDGLPGQRVALLE